MNGEQITLVVKVAACKSPINETQNLKCVKNTTLYTVIITRQDRSDSVHMNWDKKMKQYKTDLTLKCVTVQLHLSYC